MTRPVHSPIVWVAAAALAFVGCSQAGGVASADGRDVAVAFLDALRAGRVEDAWAGSSSEFKSLMGLGSLRESVKRHPALKSDVQYDKAVAFDREGGALFEHVFRGSSTRRGKVTPETIKVLVAAWEDGWKVERLSFD